MDRPATECDRASNTKEDQDALALCDYEPSDVDDLDLILPPNPVNTGESNEQNLDTSIPPAVETAQHYEILVSAQHSIDGNHASWSLLRETDLRERLTNDQFKAVSNLSIQLGAMNRNGPNLKFPHYLEEIGIKLSDLSDNALLKRKKEVNVAYVYRLWRTLTDPSVIGHDIIRNVKPFDDAVFLSRLARPLLANGEAINTGGTSPHAAIPKVESHSYV